MHTDHRHRLLRSGPLLVAALVAAGGLVVTAPPANAAVIHGSVAGFSDATFDGQGRVTGFEGGLALLSRVDTNRCLQFATAHGLQRLDAAFNSADAYAVLYQDGLCTVPVQVLPPKGKEKLARTVNWRSMQLLSSPPSVVPGTSIRPLARTRTTGGVRLSTFDEQENTYNKPVLNYCINLNWVSRSAFLATVEQAGNGVLRAYTDTLCTQGEKSVSMNKKGNTITRDGPHFQSIKITS